MRCYWSDGFSISWVFCCFLCIWYVKTKFIMGLSGNVSIKHSSSRSLSPNHTLFLSVFTCRLFFIFLRHRSFTISWICFIIFYFFWHYIICSLVSMLNDNNIKNRFCGQVWKKNEIEMSKWVIKIAWSRRFATSKEC